MTRRLFLISGNMCGERVRLGRALQKLPITQKELANRINFMGYEDMSERTISKIEKNQRHICDLELMVLAKALNVSMEWLCGEGADLQTNK